MIFITRRHDPALGRRLQAAAGTLVALAALFGASSSVMPAALAYTCPGDCEANGVVVVSELITGVRIALGEEPVTVCSALDTDGNGAVTVAELVSAVNAALRGCDDHARFPVGAYFWPDHAYGQTGSALGDLAAFGLNTVVAYYEYIKPDVPPWSGQPDCHGLVREADAARMDFFIGSPRGSELRSLDDAALTERLGATSECVGASPRYGGWMIDEPELTGYDAALLDRVVGVLRTVDPSRQVWVNFNPFATDGQVMSLGAEADLIGFDIYPIREGDGSPFPNRPLTDVGALTRRMRELAPESAEVWMILQAFGYSDLPNEGGRGRRPTPDELRFMAYDALVHGARGVMFFGSHQLRNLIPLDEPVWEVGVRRLARELREIGPALRNGESIAGVDAQPDSLSVLALRDGDADLVIAANASASPQDGRIDLGARIVEAWEIFEHRAAPVEAGQVRDLFPAYGVHVYRLR